MLKLHGVNKSYHSGDHLINVLKNITFEIKKGEFVAIIGPSGSGKSTLLGISAGLDKPDSGEVYLSGELISKMNENKLCKIRSEKIGFIFQNFQLIRNLNALENVSLPLIIRGKDREEEIRLKSMNLLESVGLKDRMTHFPSQLSGGEEQRVAIARAFINDPLILFADEPTGNLDSENGKSIMNLLMKLNKLNGATLVVVTHDPVVANSADRVLRMNSGDIDLIFKPETKSAPRNKKK